MQLSLKEAAQLIGRSERTLRGWFASGRIAARKVDGRWRVHRKDLPLTDAQRRQMGQRVDHLRDVVDAALPSRLGGGARRSLADDDLFRAIVDLVAAADACAIEPPLRAHLVASARALGAARYAFKRSEKVAALQAARAALGWFAADVLVNAQGRLEGPEVALVVLLEADVLRRLGGRLKWAESLKTAT